MTSPVLVGNRLISVAQPLSTGIGWSGSASGGHALAGVSHGAAGISYALFALATATGESHYANTAQAGIAYERTLFAAEAGNWRDLRHGDHTSEEEDAHMIAWCHGAPGVGMARVQTLTYWQDEAIHDEIRAALNTTLAHGFGLNHSLCHGDLGNLDFVLQAALQSGDATLFTQVRRIAASVLTSIDSEGWLCGVPLGVETPGLMTGLAGIGYGLLRVAAPHRVPSVLTLEGPVSVPYSR